MRLSIAPRKLILPLAGLIVLSSISAAESLSSRYKRLSCAVVQVQFDGGTGTAFFTSPDGDLLTVAHVLYDKTFKLAANQIVTEVSAKKNLTITMSDSRKISLQIPPAQAEDQRRASYDLAAVGTGEKTPCFIPIGDSNTAQIGDHLISIGFPASATAGVLYDGFLSSRHSHLPSAVGFLPNGQAVSANYEVLRVQMPITPGASGSPVINDSGEAVGVVSEVPVLVGKEVSEIASVFGQGQANSGVQLSGFDVTKTLGELAFLVTEFESPGAGLAVPVSYLKKPNFVHFQSRPLVPPMFDRSKPKSSFPQ